jgi:hypothetical protein
LLCFIQPFCRPAVVVFLKWRNGLFFSKESYDTQQQSLFSTLLYLLNSAHKHIKHRLSRRAAIPAARATQQGDLVRYCSAEGVFRTPATTDQSLSFSQLENNCVKYLLGLGCTVEGPSLSSTFTCLPPPLSSINLLRRLGCFGLCFEGQHQHRRDAAMAFAFRHSLLSRGYDTVRAANRGNARSQAEFGYFHFMSALRLDIL